RRGDPRRRRPEAQGDRRARSVQRRSVDPGADRRDRAHPSRLRSREDAARGRRGRLTWRSARPNVSSPRTRCRRAASRSTSHGRCGRAASRASSDWKAGTSSRCGITSRGSACRSWTCATSAPPCTWLTGTVGVALVTAGPGVTNTVTAVANATVAGTPVVVIAGCPPRPQEHMGPLQGIAHVDVMAPVTRFARTVRGAENAVRELDAAWSAGLGDGGERGAGFLELPTDVLREDVPDSLVLEEHVRGVAPRRIAPDPGAVEAAAARLWSASRPVVVTGRGARGAASELIALLDALGALYLDTQESRGLVPDEHPSVVGALRGAVMAQADVVLTVGRKLDYQLGYGSPAVFPNATFVRIGESAAEIAGNRRGDPELP